MKDDFEEIRAERERPYSHKQAANRHAGLWKQIALGIVVGYCALAVISTVGWLVATHLLTGGMTLHLP